MSIANLMRHTADVWRPVFKQGTAAQEIDFYKRQYRNVPCFIQPGASTEAFYYEQRGVENTHTIYTSRTDLDVQRNDLFEWNGRQFHVTGTQNGLFLDVYQELTATEYTEGARKRLDREEYP